MTKNIPLATPYPWESPSMEEAQRLTNQKLRKRRFVGSGFVALQKTALGLTSRLDNDAQLLLKKLLQEHGVEIDAKVANASIADKVFGSVVAPVDVLSKKAAHTDANDTEVLNGAQSGEISLFLTILQAVSDSGSTPISTKELFRSCCLAVRAGDVPASMDAREMVMAALQFMSRDYEVISSNLVSLPLIRPSQELADLERRTFSKWGDWTMDDEFKQKILRLEQIFTSSSSSWKWLKREFAAPRLSQKDEYSLFLKGAIPASAIAKRPSQQTVSRKRKANAIASSSENDANANPRPCSPSLLD